MNGSKTYACAIVALLAASSGVNAATWTLGDVESQICRYTGGSVNVKFCHNCADRAGAQPYVSWTFVAKCDGKVTSRRARGELRCIAGQYGNESAQKATITANARAQLPGAGVACPK
jgi:hypothetical protein